MTKLKKIAFGGVLGALAVALAAVENLLPSYSFLPPGCRIGFSNIATMLAASNISPSTSFAVTIFKSIFVLITRGTTASLLSLAGGIASTAAVVIIIKMKKRKTGYIGLGVLAATAHNAAQVLVYFFLIGTASFYYAPVVFIFGTVSGAVTGFLFYYTDKALKRFI